MANTVSMLLMMIASPQAGWVELLPILHSTEPLCSSHSSSISRSIPLLLNATSAPDGIHIGFLKVEIPLAAKALGQIGRESCQHEVGKLISTSQRRTL